MSANYEQAEIMLILKYGSIKQACDAWWHMGEYEEDQLSKLEFEIIMKYVHKHEIPKSS